MTTTPTLAQLHHAVKISEQIAALEAELASLFGGSTPAPAAATSAKGDARTGKRSAKTIAKMKAAQQARWAKVRTISPLDTLEMSSPKPAKKAPAAKAPSPAKKKRTMSPETKAKMAAAMKKRWAAAKAGKGPAPTAKK